MAHLWIAIGATLGFLGVAFGAFAAHGLQKRLDAYAIDIFKTGATYQMTHAIALILVGILAKQFSQMNLSVAATSFIVGTLIFSGSLYILALTGTKWWGAITPFGGVAFLIGWGSLAFQFFKRGAA